MTRIDSNDSVVFGHVLLSVSRDQNFYHWQFRIWLQGSVDQITLIWVLMSRDWDIRQNIYDQLLKCLGFSLYPLKILPQQSH